MNESAQQRQLSLERLTAGRDAEWRNRLIWGDKRYVLPSLLDEFAGEVVAAIEYATKLVSKTTSSKTISAEDSVAILHEIAR